MHYSWAISNGKFVWGFDGDTYFNQFHVLDWADVVGNMNLLIRRDSATHFINSNGNISVQIKYMG